MSIKMRKLASVVMAVIILMPMLTSCKTGKKGSNVVKADDPWYETTRFHLDADIRNSETLVFTDVCTSDCNLFHFYTLMKDQWSSLRTVLDEYDFDGNLIKRAEITCPDDRIIGAVYSVSADADGKNIKAAVYLNSDSDTVTDHGPAFVKIDTETGKITDIDVITRMGNHPTASLQNITIIGDYAVMTLDDFDDEGFIYYLLLYRDSGQPVELDMSSLNIFYLMEGFSIDLTTDSVYAVGIEREGIVTMEFDTNSGKLKSKTAYTETDDDSINFAEYTATDKGDLCKLDSFGNIKKVDFNDMTVKTMVDTNWYNPYFSPNNVDQLAVFTGIVSCDEERSVILEEEVRSYANYLYIQSYYVTVLSKADKNPHAGKEIIELALPLEPGVSDYLARAIYEFNNTDDEYFIRVWNKYKTGLSLARMISGNINSETDVYEMIQDLKGDEAPDLAIGIQKNYAMRDDVFMDLTGFLDPEVMDKQYGNIIEAGRIDGKLYFLPVTLEIEGLVTNTGLLKDGAAGITFEEYDRMIKEDLDGFSPYDYPYTECYNKRSFILSCIDTKSAIEGDKIDFGTEQFRTVVEYAKDNFEFDDLASMPEDYSFDLFKRQKGECYYARISDYLEFVHACNSSDEHYKIIGTPSVDRSGPRFRALETISVSATTDVEEGCRKFINYLFSGIAYENDDCEYLQIVTNKDIMARNISTLSAMNNDAYEQFLVAKKNAAIIMPPSVEKAFADKTATDDMRDSFLDSMSTVSIYYYEDYEITKFVMEEVAPYYSGDRSMDDVIEILNDRAAKYVREM